MEQENDGAICPKNASLNFAQVYVFMTEEWYLVSRPMMAKE